MVDLSRLECAGPHPNMRAKDAASIILFDRSGGDLKVLVGKRSKKHVFMPDLFVFPGGKRDVSDYRLSFASDLKDQTHHKLFKTFKRPATTSSTRALALAAMRELQEETGLCSWDESVSRFGPNLTPLRFVARAITPPGHIRRYDTRFFSAFVDELDLNAQHIHDSNELQELQWLSVRHKSSVRMPTITQLVLDDAIAAMTANVQSAIEPATVQYVVRHKRFHRMFL